MEPGVDLLNAISLFGRFYFALLLIIRPDHFGKRTCLYRGVGLFALLGALLRLARDILPYVAALMRALPQRVIAWKWDFDAAASCLSDKLLGNMIMR